ncbi:uncharacterized protein C8Q71DRAFT_763703 [Rhodofomes roseus]|uniref:Integral membrane protein n=1 Tax=Rhodofomes roseus TaxID=34475 RepID=A0ABQ8KF60_9APHY|nr:uncharacterized protein C8Q71DRAFT_763703 [Rhodofomes roseus]KAH9835844.1 hypothetical protein C8Q71DRAFT_763703 [Rhodofomes roseus]
MRMNFQRAWAHVPLSAQLALLWERITLSKLTTFYFVFSVLHFAIQLGLQIEAFAINANAASFLGGLVSQGNATQDGFTVWDGALRMCTAAPESLSAESCEILWQPTSMTGNSSVDLTNANVTSAVSSSIVSTASSASASSAASTTLLSSSTVSSSSSAALSSSSSSMVLTSAISTSLKYALSTAVTSSTSLPSASTKASVLNSTSSATRTVTVTHATSSSATPSSTSEVSSTDEEVEYDEKDVEDEDEDEDDEHHHRRSISSQPVVVNGQHELKFSGDGFNDVTLSYTCLTVLNWPLSQLDNTKREDITFIMFQFWLLAMSLVALLNESIPHIIATLLMHVAASAWGGFQIYDTALFHSEFSQLATNGACHVNLLPTYWDQRADVEIPSLALNGVALIVSAVLSWRLIKSFGWQTFKRVGASRTINRIYNVVLLLSISIQVALFFIAVTAGLWIDQLINGYIACHTDHALAFKVVDVVVLAILVPWLGLGWVSVRREKRLPMLAFLLLAVVYLAGWGSMFAAATFRWTFVQWRFFSIMASASVLLAVVTLVLGIICRVNFGKGLPRYLNAEEPLSDGDDFLPTAVETKAGKDVEKVEFPSTNTLVPTYMGSYPDQVEPSARAMGPRFFNSSVQPFESQPDPPPMYGAYGSGSPMSSKTAVGETHSLKRTPTNSSNASSGSNNSTRSKRWVIE